jgi:hypothetical protein
MGCERSDRDLESIKEAIYGLFESMVLDAAVALNIE